MTQEKLLTVRDVAFALGISEKEVVDLAEKGIMPAYKVGGVYLRFKKEQVEEFRKSIKAKSPKPHPLEKCQIKLPQETAFKDRISDFLYFNDFYILTGLIIFLLLVIIFRG